MGRALGKVTIELDENNQIISKKAVTFATEKLPIPPNETAEIQAFLDKGREELSEKVVAIPES